MSPQPLDVSTFLVLIRRRARLIGGIALGAALLAFAVSSLLPDQYDASSSVLFRPAESPPQIDPDAPPPDVSAEPERIAATNIALASLDIVAVRVKQRIDSSESAEELRESVSIEPQGQADLAKITARGPSPSEAARVADAFAFEIVALRREKAQDTIQRVIDAIEAQLAAGAPSDGVESELEARQQQLEIEKRLEAGDAEVVEQAVPPTEPSSPQPVRNAVIGLILGLILGVVVALLMRRFDRGVAGENEVVDIVGAPIVARVPAIETRGWKHELTIEAFQFLRANLQLGSATADARVFAVASALPGEGKSTAVLRLAQALATSGSTVIVADCDLRRPVLHDLLELDGSSGVTTALSSDVDPADLLVQTPIKGARLLPAGQLRVLPGSLVTGGEHDMEQLLSRLKELADYVIVDTSPVTIGADASIIAAKVDASLMVVDIKSVDRRALTAAVDQLHNAEANIAGVVLNHADELLKSRAYQGYYGATAADAAARAQGLGAGGSANAKINATAEWTPPAGNGHSPSTDTFPPTPGSRRHAP